MVNFKNSVKNCKIAKMIEDESFLILSEQKYFCLEEYEAIKNKSSKIFR